MNANVKSCLRWALVSGALGAAASLALSATTAKAAPSRSEVERQKMFNDEMTRCYGSKGPSSTSRERGAYRGSGGVWRRR